MNYFKKFTLLSIISLAFLNCGNDDSSSPSQGNSRITVKLMDAPGDYDHVFIDVVDVMVKVNDASNDEGGWQSLNAVNTGIYDLLELTGGVNILLVDEFEVLSGTLNQIRLILGDDNSVVIDGQTYPLNTPSAQQSGLKIQVNETLLPNIAYTFLLDFDVDESIVIAGNSGNINLKPVIRASVEATTGTITGSVLPLGVQTEITVTNGIDIISAYADIGGNFILVGLNPGIYTVTVDPDPLSGLSSVNIENVEVTLESNTNLGVITLE
jgi:hypothetical protein